MTEKPSWIEEPGWLIDARAADHLCDRFEAAWRGNCCPSLEDFLALAPLALRADTFRQLLLLDVEYQQVAGETPHSDNYLVVFNDFSAVILEVFSQRPSPLAVETLREGLRPGPKRE